MAQPVRKRATLYDVADAADVSAQTVSRVVNNPDRVAPKTRARVLRAMQELDYQPNFAAQRLKTQRSYTVQVFIFHAAYPTPYTAILKQAKALGYKAIFDLLDPASPEELQAALDDASRLLTDGIIMIAPPDLPDLTRLDKMARGIAIVQLGAHPGSQIASVGTDQVLGSRLAAQHLLDLGHRRIAEICGPVETNSDAYQRHTTFLKVLAEHSLQLVDSIVGGFGGFSHKGGYQAAMELVEQDIPFTAIFAANDHLALGAIKLLTERGLRVPEDVSVIGFDDSFGAAFYNPALTTIRQNFDVMGAQALQYLVELIEQPGTPVQQRLLYPELIVRESTRAVQML